MSARYRPQYSETTIQGDAYLVKNIKAVPDEAKYLCQPFDKLHKTKDPFFGNLLSHVNSKKHRKTANNKTIIAELEKAVVYLQEGEKALKASMKNGKIETEGSEKNRLNC